MPLSMIPYQSSHGKIFVDQWPVNAIPSGGKLGLPSFFLRGGGELRRANLARNSRLPLWQNQYEVICGRLDSFRK